MNVTTEGGILTVSANTYSITVPTDRPFVYVDDAAGHRLLDLFVPSSVHTVRGQDDTVDIGSWDVEVEPDEIILSISATSSVWHHKTYRLRCRPTRFLYDVTVTGSAHLADLIYLGGYYSGHPRWGSGFFQSGQTFRRGFTPEPNAQERNYFSPAGSATIDLVGVPLPGKASWFFTPPPFCFAFEHLTGWLGIGIEADAGAYRFTNYRYHGTHNSFYLVLSYEGHTEVDGRYRLPALGFEVGTDEYDVLDAHVQALQLPQRESATKPDWWYEPIFCGWGAQCARAIAENGAAPEYARQAEYDAFLSILAACDIDPGIVVLDDKWQVTYGENAVDTNKWPDLRGFIDRQHAAGRKVLLWLKAWDPEGVPADECIRNAAGLPLSIDPTNPAYEHRLRASIRRMLSPDGYDADGFKIDFTARIPSGPDLSVYGDAWGLELMKRYLGVIHHEAKTVKDDALIMTHTPHPYLADVVDMIRLNDINVRDGIDINEAMTHRARVAAIACPDAIIDTDNWPARDKATWRRFVRIQPQLGVPSLYYTSHIDSTQEPLDADDYRLIRDVWAEHRAQIRRNGPALPVPAEKTPATRVEHSAFSIRGVVEGFYGPMYTFPQRNDLIRFLGKHDYNVYVYGPKNDRWHRERWRVPYPPKLMARFAETVAIAGTAGVTFCYTLSPGLSIDYAAEDDFRHVVSKLTAFYELGVRAFALLLDDLPSILRNTGNGQHERSVARAQAAFCNRVYDWLRTLDDTCTLWMCPTMYYGRAPFSDYVRQLGESLYPEIGVFYTGPATCARMITVEDVAGLTEAMQRAPIIWDNYPVNDLRMQAELHIGPIRGREPALHESVAGIVVNPMLQPEASRIPLLTYAEYLHDPAGYDPDAAWARALEEVAGAESAEPLRLFAETSLHSCLGTTEAERLERLVQSALHALRGATTVNGTALHDLEAYLTELDDACYHLQTQLQNLALRNELLPWIDALQRWIWMGQRALLVLRAQERGESDEYSLHRMRELLAEAQAHHKRIAGNVLAALADYVLERVPAT